MWDKREVEHPTSFCFIKATSLIAWSGELKAQKKVSVMKKLFFMIVAAGLTLTAAAQKTEKQVATLQHGNQTMVFYGIDAFVQAYNAAADTLDVITLSGGEFNSTTISKSIAIYGAGCEDDSITGTQRTVLNGITLVPADGLNGDGLVTKAEKKVNDAENLITTLENEISEMEAELAKGIVNDELLKNYASKKHQLELATDAWETAQTELDELTIS